ncbi:MAG: tRNA uridine-5-carboxymethylaminomethyl(34) synthesis GTPase MnmE [Muribaculaceae bacterium]
MIASYTNDDTICAISTPAGMGGIAVIRVSGRDAVAIVARCWQGAAIEQMKSHTAHLGRITDPADGSVLDEVVLTVFRAPRSFTGEDVIEISCHGSRWIQQEMINLLIRSGCRSATGGEFTRRAFTNGRLDLSQAEAVADVIASSSRASHRIAMSQMRGDFSRQLSTLRERLLHFVSLMELELDFSEEEVEFADRSHLVALAEEIRGVIAHLTDSFAVGNAIKNGLPVAIVGETNAGKSTLLNYLLHDDRALVSDIHGTTRDVIEDTITLGGTLFRFIDTAGIRDTSDRIEAMGIERTFRKMSEAQVVLWVIDGTTDVNELPQLAARILPALLAQKNGSEAGSEADGVTGKGAGSEADGVTGKGAGGFASRLIAVVNKGDLLNDEQQATLRDALARLLPEDTPTIIISAREHANLDALQHALLDAAAIPENDANEVIVTNARHYEALTHAGEAINRAIDGLQAGISGDFVSQDIRECMHYLGEITGEITPTDVLSSIFQHFCIGK